jgi:hypothetical protein
MSTTTSSPTASSGIDLKTLWITAVASAAAAFVTSKVWAPGTLAAAAFTPVLVAVIREGLAKSTAVVARAVPVKGVVRSATPAGAPPADASREASGDWAAAEPVDREASGGWAAADLIAAEHQPGALPYPEDPATRVAQPGEISYHGSGAKRARNWRVAIITGLLGFVIAAVVFTVPELVAGNSASGSGGTTLFGGKQRDKSTPALTTTTTTAPPKTVTTPPESTVTVPPQTVTTPPPAATGVPEEDPQTTVPDPDATAPVPPPVAEPPPPAEVPPG